MPFFLLFDWSWLEISFLIIIFVIGLLATSLIIPLVIKFSKKKGYVGIDIHKNAHPEVPESGGLSLVFGFLIAFIMLMIFFPEYFNKTLILLLTLILAGFIGFIDDRVKLRSRYKVLLTILTGSILYIAYLFSFITISSPIIPFLGKLRLTVLYPILSPLIIAIFSNIVNMLEGYNGEGSGTCLIALIFIFICGIIWQSTETIIYTIASIGVLIPFFKYNKFPARIFPGDVGTLTMGALLGCIALFGSLEAAVFCALFIHIFNGFYVLYSVKGFLESSDIQEKKSDIVLLEDDKIRASYDKEAALTLPRLILADGPLTEPELVFNFYIITIICGFFSIFTIIMMRWTIGSLDFSVVIITSIIISILITLILIKYKRIRGITYLMILLLIFGYFLLFLIKLLIIPNITFDIIIFYIRIPLNILISVIIVLPFLSIWYYITIKYFWFKLRKKNEEFH